MTPSKPLSEVCASLLDYMAMSNQRSGARMSEIGAHLHSKSVNPHNKPNPSPQGLALMASKYVRAMLDASYLQRVPFGVTLTERGREALGYYDNRRYMEFGCLCIITKRVPFAGPGVADDDAAFQYLCACKCSRHPDGKDSENYDGDLEKIMLQEVRDAADKYA